MNSYRPALAGPLLHKLDSLVQLPEEERQAILALPVRLVSIEADQDLVSQGDRPSKMLFVVDGLVCSYKIVGGGERQIISFHLAGDAPDLQSVHLTTLDFSIATITRTRVGFVQHDAILALCSRFPRITAALWLHTLVDAAIFREWVANVGQRQGVAKLAHLICEMFVRFSAAGLKQGDTVPFPITQVELGEAVGLSTVHVNRSLQELRRQKLFELSDSRLTVTNWSGLQAAGDFRSDYLHFRAGAEQL